MDVDDVRRELAAVGLEHLIVDERGRTVGIIDFEDAHVGDPHVDLVPILAEHRRPLSDRMAFYRWCGSLHALVYYVREGLHDEIPGAVAGLRRRLDAGPWR